MEMIPIGKLCQHPDNPRKELGDLVELTQSIKRSGIMQNLTVVKKEDGSGLYTVIIGHRRLAASRIAGLTELPCVVVNMTPEEQVATMLAENMQRVDLTLCEQAQGLQLMFDFGETVESVSRMTGLSVSTVRRRKKLLEFRPETLKTAVEHGATLTDLAELEELEDPEEKNRCLEKFGTPDFRWTLNRALIGQKSRKAAEEWREYLKNSEAEPLTDSAPDEVKMIASVCAASSDPSIAKYEDRPLFYGIENGYIYFYTPKEGKEAEESEISSASQEQLTRQEAKQKLAELTAIAYATRMDFISKVSERDCVDIFPEVVCSLIKAECYGLKSYSSPRERMGKFCNMDLGAYSYHTMTGFADFAEHTKELWEGASRSPRLYLFYMLMALLEPGECDGYFSAYSVRPIYQKCPNLDEEYRIIALLGYEMSEEEQALHDGSHTLFELGGE